MSILLSDILLVIAIFLEALTLYAMFTRPPEDTDPGGLRMDIVVFIGILVASSYVCHIKGW